MGPTFDVAAVRQQFPALQGKQVYFDNAGGSQVLKSVIDSIAVYLSTNNVQLGASYPVSQKSTNLYEIGCQAAARYINAQPSEVVLGPSTTQLFRNLSLALWEHVTPGCEIVVSKLDHEANIAAWVQLAQWRGAKLVWWEAPGKHNPKLEPSVLKSLLSSKTRLVTCTHTSNILGTITDIAAIAETVHSIPGAFLCVDAVAYAPHRRIDVQAFGADFYSFSWYKVYGPHMAMLYASTAAQAKLITLGHFFKPLDTLENLLGLSNASYELVQTVPLVCDYLEQISWEHIAEYEETLQKILLDYLLSKPETFQIWGEPTADHTKRVPVISFTVRGRKSKDVVDAIEARSDYGCRWGAFYSNRLAEDVMGIDPIDGVVRVSLLHYNTEAEVRGYIKVLDEVVSS